MGSTKADPRSAERRLTPVVLATLAFGLASVPTGLAIGHILIVPVTVLFICIATGLWTYRFRSASTLRPSPVELMLAFADALILPCFLGAIWIGLYWGIHGLTLLAGGSGTTIAMWISTSLVAFFAWFFAEASAADIGKELYPTQ